MPATTTASRTGTTARNEIIEMLKADHRKAKKAFEDFERLDPEQDAEQCEAIVAQTCSELMLHMRLEEDCFYPATREAIDDTDQMDEAELEHASAKSLIQQLRDMSPEDDKWAARFTVLGEYINHHVKEEETGMFPEVSKKKLDWADLLQQMRSRRQVLMEEEMPEGAAEKAQESDAEATPAGTRTPTPARSAPRTSSRGTGERARAAEGSDEEDA